MSSPSVYADAKTRPPLDESLYSLTVEESQFFKTQTGIENDDELKSHILAIQKKAYAVYGYPCIRHFGFIKLRIAHTPAYRFVLDLCRNHKDAIFLDIGCCFGNDTRKLVADGWPIENVIASDIQPAFWDLGHELFRTSQETFPAAFLAGDVFDTNFLPADETLPTVPPQTPSPDLARLTSFAPLRGRLSVIFADAFFHLFGEDEQAILASRLANLLLPQPGSIIFGRHLGLDEKGRQSGKLSEGPSLFCHSPISWRDLWENQIFKDCSVKVEASLVRVEERDVSLLVWSITRL